MVPPFLEVFKKRLDAFLSNLVYDFEKCSCPEAIKIPATLVQGTGPPFINFYARKSYLIQFFSKYWKIQGIIKNPMENVSILTEICWFAKGIELPAEDCTFKKISQMQTVKYQKNGLKI